MSEHSNSDRCVIPNHFSQLENEWAAAKREYTKSDRYGFMAMGSAAISSASLVAGAIGAINTPSGLVEPFSVFYLIPGVLGLVGAHLCLEQMKKHTQRGHVLLKKFVDKFFLEKNPGP